MWLLAASSGWTPAWESALAADRTGNPLTIGNDPAVITDGMILAAVKALRP
jgi:hypothetical protein